MAKGRYDETINVRDELFGLREDRELFDALKVVQDPINDGMAVAPDLVGAHVAERRGEPVRGMHWLPWRWKWLEQWLARSVHLDLAGLLWSLRKAGSLRPTQATLQAQVGQLCLV